MLALLGILRNPARYYETTAPGINGAVILQLYGR